MRFRQDFLSMTQKSIKPLITLITSKLKLEFMRT